MTAKILQLFPCPTRTERQDQHQVVGQAGDRQADAEPELLVDQLERLARDQLDHLALGTDRAARVELDAMLAERAPPAAVRARPAPARFAHGPAVSAAPRSPRSPGANLGGPVRPSPLPSIDNPKGSTP